MTGVTRVGLKTIGHRVQKEWEPRGKGKRKGPLRIMLGRYKAFTEEGFLPLGHRTETRCRYLVFAVDWEAIKMILVPSPPSHIPTKQNKNGS